MAAELTVLELSNGAATIDYTKNQHDEQGGYPHRGVKAAIFWFD